MKKLSIALISISTLALTSSITFAEPVGIHVELRCPITNDQESALANYGDFIAGYGFENVQGLSNKVYFKSKSIPSELTTDFTTYRNSNAKYDSTSGEVTCQYVGPGPQFSVSYQLTNGKGGFVSRQSVSDLSIVLPVAFVKKA